jgi:UTP--glucose-1-phosphate uridylyltransferase
MNEANYTNPSGIPYTFTQHKHPKLYLDDLSVTRETNDEHNWNPPGHGDIYASLLATGIAQKLLSAGKRYIFVANSDNLGATVAPEILGYMIHNHFDFLMETCQRTAADRKGGHLARRVDNGRLLLREVAQAPTDDNGEVIREFQDISKYSQFNTNSIWLDLEKAIKIAELHNGCIPLPLIRNIKPVNTEDRTSRKAVQIETAMGAAIEVFTNSQAIQVPRDRFMPVKTVNDLLLIMSDRYRVSPDGHLVLEDQLTNNQPPRIDLDQAFFGMISDFQGRVLICPSLRSASSLKVTGDWLFDASVNIVGDVHLNGRLGSQHRISELGTTDLTGEITPL